MKQVAVHNKTRNIILAGEALVADTALTRLRGLLGRPPLENSQALIIRPSQGIHTFFMSYPIDAIYVGSEGQIVRCLEHLRPFRFAPISLRTRFVAEFPAGTLKRTGTRVGDRVELR